MSKVAIIVGSENDRPYAQEAKDILDSKNITANIHVASAHRDHIGLEKVIEQEHANGVKVFICMAGLAAALPGTVAARTNLPVIGVPLDVGPLNGIDALLAIVQMPAGVPVGTMGIGKAGAKNAAHFTAKILAVEVIGDHL